MNQIKRGELLIPGRTRWPEGFEYNYTISGHEIRIFMRSPQRAEIKSVRKGVLNLALYVEQDIPVVLLKTEAIPWCDCPFSYWLVPDQYRQIPPQIQPGQKSIIPIILIDADTGIVEVIRVITLSHDFSDQLHRAIQSQIGAGEFTPNEFVNRSGLIQKSTAEELAQQAICAFATEKNNTKRKGFG